MEQVKYRKYPRAYNNRHKSGNGEKSIELSGLVAGGILALAFAKGMFWGYMLKRRLGN